MTTINVRADRLALGDKIVKDMPRGMLGRPITSLWIPVSMEAVVEVCVGFGMCDRVPAHMLITVEREVDEQPSVEPTVFYREGQQP